MSATSPAATVSAAAAGQFRLGSRTVNRLGFGAMRITGQGIWGPPRDRTEAIAVLRRLPELGIDFVDTAHAYGPGISEDLIREALHPYEGLLVATKGGLRRPGPDRWVPDGRPAQLIAEAKESLKRLGVDQIALWQLHRIDSKVPRDEQFGAIRRMLDEGLIALAGLSEVSVAEIKAAEAVFPVATVQNRYNLSDRAGEEVLAYCEERGIGFIPWYPLAAGDLARPGSLLDGIAKRHRATPAQVALAWILRRSPVMLPIPGTSKRSHLEENVAAAGLRLSEDDFAALDRESRV